MIIIYDGFKRSLFKLNLVLFFVLALQKAICLLKNELNISVIPCFWHLFLLQKKQTHQYPFNLVEIFPEYNGNIQKSGKHLTISCKLQFVQPILIKYNS